MKFKIDNATLQAVAHCTRYSYNIQSNDHVTNLFMRSALESIMFKLAKLRDRITTSLTLRLNPVETFVLKISAEIYAADYPNNVETLLLTQYILSPMVVLN